MSAIATDTTEIALNNSTILIIDDNPTNLGVVVDRLEASGFVVLVARDGESGIKRTKFARPHLVLLDVLMPGTDGFEICRRLKADVTTKDIPVIFMTALSSTEDKVKGFAIGAVDFITKPIHREELLARVTTHLRIQALTQQLQRQNQQLQQQAWELKQAQEAAEVAYRELQRLANLDSLTQIANRRRFDEYLNLEWRRMLREQTPLSLILCDIDYFKHYNDCYGHQAGDDCLRQIAQAIARTLNRPGDLVARYGGEEFAIILSNTPVLGAVQIAELVLAGIAQLKIPHAQSEVSTHVTVSLGISSQIPQANCLPHILITAADRALYHAKKVGRDRYCVYSVSRERTSSYQ
ncbi:diguanylate cyclase [Chroococcidiopsis sp. FACHB-1243]|uniref:diguanylate cyclase domain-containing protein n=1 Tax=Chroococcidiopsis sp. [FACHB-1243] TaxID=2692781 RepID=UPI00177FB8C3|nr:diguanylate cyclase [Chroococcidiopsis sp. [FACHB-1243]]MBD2305024.1 diguanylate cyclase [Chroococcidiopsis sp. [FACHB-1243]]